jgi:hypothetical protein
MRRPAMQNLLNLVIIAIISGIIVLLAPVHSTVPRGILLPLSAASTPIKPQQVSTLATWHSGIKPVGVIHISLFPGDGKRDNNLALYQKSISLAKQLAAQYGANVISVGSVVNYLKAGPLNIYQLTIKAGRQ